MNAVVMTLPLLIVIVTLVYTVTRNIGRVWLEHRVRMVLLEKLEDQPELINSFHELHGLLDPKSSEDEKAGRQDYLLTGVMLAVLGVVCVILYSTIGGGRWAVGAYWGGVACVVLGFLLALLGLLLRFLARSPSGRRSGGQEP
jgi:hypothetical protein